MMIRHLEMLLRGQWTGNLLFLPSGQIHFLRLGHLRCPGQDIRDGNLQGAGGLRGRGQNGLVAAGNRLQREVREIPQAGFDNLDGAAVLLLAVISMIIFLIKRKRTSEASHD